MLIKEILSSKDSDAIRQLMASIIMDIHENGAIDIQQLEKLSYIKSFHQTLFAEQENELLYVLGLFYKTKDPESFFEACYQVYADVIKNETQENFTPIQADILEHIKKHKFFSFSAPTSVGKSYLFRYLITNAKNDVVVVVPSRALITEYILEITRVVDKDVLVLQFIDDINKTNTNRRIFVVTPERARELFKLKNRFNIELFLFDEAQIAEEYMRGMLFDALVRRINTHFPDSKKIFAHPFIENPEAQFIKHNINTDTGKFLYNQQSVGKIYMSLKDDKLSYFSPFESEKLFDKIPETSDIIYEKLKTDGTTLLVYISKENIYNGSCLEKFKKYIELCPKIIDADALKIIEEFRDFIGAEENAPSVMIDMMKRGIVIHHGSIPLYGRLLIEKFVKLGFAKICFATSTLIQGINMPFDMVWIDKFQFNGSETDKVIGLKNLIGRAGRTSLNQSFDYGYVIIPDSHIKSFSERLKKIAKLNEESELNKKVETIEEDLQDVVEAIQKDTFNDEYMMPEIQIERMKNADIDADIQYILDNLLSNNVPLKWQEYNKLSLTSKIRIKEAFENIYSAHLRRNELTKGEKAVLSTSIQILLWLIQGRSFKAILANRYAYITKRDDQRNIEKEYKERRIDSNEQQAQLDSIILKFSQIATQLPNKGFKNLVSIFPTNSHLSDFKYDILVFDTYDYLDKVIYFSLATPLSGAFHQYYEKTEDKRAEIMKNYIKYGTNDPLEIWLTRYGFSFENIEWLKGYVNQIDENGISFKPEINRLPETKLEVINRFI